MQRKTDDVSDAKAESRFRILLMGLTKEYLNYLLVRNLLTIFYWRFICLYILALPSLPYLEGLFQNLFCLTGHWVRKKITLDSAPSPSLSLLVQGRQSVLLFAERANVFPENPLAMRIAVMMMTM